MAYITKLSSIRPDYQPEANFTDFVIDSDLLRDDPQVVLRKSIFESIKKINSVENYKNYGVVMEVISTTNPKSSLGRLIKQASGAGTSDFKEYLVYPIDKPSVSVTSYLSKPLDIYKSTTLLRCIPEDTSLLIPKGSLVRLEYDNNLKDEAVITKVFGELPPILEENAASTPSDVYKAPPCADVANVTPTSDPINGNQSQPVENASAPVPTMSTAPCSKIEQPIANYAPVDGDEKISEFFTLRDLTVARARIPNVPDAKQIERLKVLCADILDPLRKKYGKFVINSAFRSKEINNDLKNASKTSQHLDGEAADIKFNGLSSEEVFDRFEAIRDDKSIPYFQLILECDNIHSYWIHISIRRENQPSAPSSVLSFGPWSDEKQPDNKIKRKYLRYDRRTIKLNLASKGITEYFV